MYLLRTFSYCLSAVDSFLDLSLLTLSFIFPVYSKVLRTHRTHCSSTLFNPTNCAFFAIFKDSSKETGKELCFCDRPGWANCLTIQFKIDSLWNYLLCVDTTLVNPLTLVPFCTWFIGRWLNKQKNIPLKMAWYVQGLEWKKTTSVQRKTLKEN